MVTSTNLSIYYQNVRGLRTKTNIRSDISASSRHDLIMFTEHWLNDSFSSSEYFDDSYSVERDDRNSTNKRCGGGSLIAIKNNLVYRRIREWEQQTIFDNVWIELRNNSNISKKTFINVDYIPPQTRFNDYSEYFDIVTEIICLREPNAKFIIAGDFNMGTSIEWLTYDRSCIPISHDGESASELINMLDLNDLKQINNLRNINGRTLDLLLTNSNEISLHSTNALSKVDSHHPPFLLNFNASDIKFIKPNKSINLIFFKANYFMINNEMQQIN